MTVIDFTERQIAEFIERKRPPVEIRNQLDIGYKLENQVVEIFEIRPRFNDENIKNNMPIAKAKFIKSKNVWKIYWMPSSLKWTAYEAQPEVRTIADFIDVVEEDPHYCFWG